MTRTLVILAIVFANLTCATPQKALRWDCPPADGPLLETVTFNAGLAPGIVPYATPRTPAVAEAVGKLRGVGLICLQEVWEPAARDAIIGKLDLPEENVFHADTFGEGETHGLHRCAPGLIEPLLRCTERRCKDYSDEDKSICAKRKCFMQLAQIYFTDKSCIQCLLSSVGHSTDEVRRMCTSEGGQCRTYHGSNGMLLASRWPLKNREVIRLPSSGVNRVALLATVDVPGMGEIEVGCTHLSSETLMDPIIPGFDEWSDEMVAQFDLAERRLKERAGERPQLFLGDFNAGPGRDGYGMHWPPTHRGVELGRVAPRVWRRILRSGFHSPASRVKPTFCTTCSDNLIRLGQTNHLIDHVLVRDPKGGLDLEAVCAHPWFDQPIPAITTTGEPVSLSFSDHYGAVVKFRKRPNTSE